MSANKILFLSKCTDNNNNTACRFIRKPIALTVTAIAKDRVTEQAWLILNDAMDIHAG